MADLHKRNLKEIQLNILRKLFSDNVKRAPSLNETFCEDYDMSMDPDPTNFETVTR